MSKKELVRRAIKLAAKFKSDLRQQYKDSMSYPDAAEIADIKKRGGDSPTVSINNAFDYIEKSKNQTQARSRAKEMFEEFDVDGAIEEAGGLEKAFRTAKVSPIKKKLGGAVQSKTQSRGNFPDLTGDGKVTKKDVLRGRGVPGFKKGGSAKKKGLGTKRESKWG